MIATLTDSAGKLVHSVESPDMDLLRMLTDLFLLSIAGPGDRIEFSDLDE